jgi:hypothetical protein
MLEKTIAQLEAKDWGEPPDDAPPHAVRCYRLRRKPISSLTLADIRLLIGQDVGLPYLVPIALKTLRSDPLVKTEYYCGDLLANILRISPAFYEKNPKFRRDVASLKECYYNFLPFLNEIDAKYAKEAIEEAVALGGW